MRMRTDSYVSGTGLLQSFLEAEINLNHHDRSFLPWVAPASMERRENLLISIGGAARLT